MSTLVKLTSWLVPSGYSTTLSYVCTPRCHQLDIRLMGVFCQIVGNDLDSGLPIICDWIMPRYAS